MPPTKDHYHWTHPIVLAVACAIEGSGSCRSAALFAQLVERILRSYNPHTIGHFDRPEPCRVQPLRKAWTLACTLSANDWIVARRATGRTSLWGKIFWQALHNMSALFTPKTHSLLLHVIHLMPFMLPCRECRMHARANVAAFDGALRLAKTRGQFVDIVIELHNFVTTQLKPKSSRKLYAMLPQPRRGYRHRLTVAAALIFVRLHGYSSIRDGAAAPTKDCGCDATDAVVVAEPPQHKQNTLDSRRQ